MMETLCTVIANSKMTSDIGDYVDVAEPLMEAIEKANDLHSTCEYKFVRVYAETNNGATLTLIYQPT